MPRLITGGFDIHRRGTFHNTFSRAPRPRPKHLQGKSSQPKFDDSILASKRLWGSGFAGSKYLQPQVAEVLGHDIFITTVIIAGKPHWKWSIESIMCLGISQSRHEARITAIKEVLRWLGPPRKYDVLKNLARLAGR
ncbi:MAG: hypothetical protein C0467_16115 [Planctomycetaceae bacterium]|nr:hypothetical protein [Planctomycetaceae bacterium]